MIAITQKEEINQIEAIGKSLMAAFEKIEGLNLEKQIAFLDSSKEYAAEIADALSKIPDLESNGK